MSAEIAVGTQVRLTGVVTKINGDDVIVALVKDGHNTLIGTYSHFLEVIRQPFRRGEVVWSCGAVATGEQFVVFNDEFEGRVDVVHCLTGTATTDNAVSRFERRP